MWLKDNLKENNKHSFGLECMNCFQYFKGPIVSQTVKTNTHSRQKSLRSHFITSIAVVFSAWQRWESEKLLTLAMVTSLVVRNRYLKGTSGGPRHCIWTPDCPLKLSCYPALDPGKRFSEMVCFYRYGNSAFPTPRCPHYRIFFYKNHFIENDWVLSFSTIRLLAPCQWGSSLTLIRTKWWL